MTTDDPRELARLLLVVADSIDAPGATFVAGVLRRAARLVAELPAPPGPDRCRSCGAELKQPPTAPGPDRCRGCGAELSQPPTGRRRIWCSDRCRRKHGGKAQWWHERRAADA